MPEAVSVLIPDWSYTELHSMFSAMPMNELKDEYVAAMHCLDCFFGVSQELVDSGLREYISSWIDVMRIVIAERVCSTYAGVGLPERSCAGRPTPIELEGSRG